MKYSDCLILLHKNNSVDKVLKIGDENVTYLYRIF